MTKLIKMLSSQLDLFSPREHKKSNIKFYGYTFISNQKSIEENFKNDFINIGSDLSKAIKKFQISPEALKVDHRK